MHAFTFLFVYHLFIAQTHNYVSIGYIFITFIRFYVTLLLP